MEAILPFSSLSFIYFILGATAFIHLAKFINLSFLSYRNALTTITLSYIVFFFPKPEQWIGCVLYGYGIYYFLGRKLKLEGILIPVLLLFLPLIILKSFVFFPKPEGFSLWYDIFQLAGLSYLTFKSVQFYIDERHHEKAPSFLAYFQFISFTPTLLIGPLERFKRFNDQVELGYVNLTLDHFVKGWEFFLKGLFYKYICAQFIDLSLLSHLDEYPIYLRTILDIIGYLFYLFFDFAGYSLLAIGFGRWLGINVPINFDKPFLALNPKDFWKRWHISLGDWLNDYFFKPIFKELTSKGYFTPITRQNIALFSTFTLMGCWNGFELHFIVSGMLFGLYSIVHNYYVYRCKKDKKDVLFQGWNIKLVEFFSISFHFILVAIAIYIFSGKLF